VIRSSSLIVATGIGLLFAARLISPQDASAGSRVIEIRAYTLKPGTRESFHDLFVRQSLPLLRRHNVDVIAYGPSLHDALSYYLVRSFSSLDDRMRSEDAFYASKEWREGPRDRVLAAIETYSTVVVSVDPETVRAMRHLMPELTTQANQKGSPMEDSTLVTTASDVTTLLALNEDYIRSVESSDVQRFREMLADDFMCSLPDGTHLDRDAFLKHVAAPAGISGLQAHDINVRVMGDFALVHARTTFTRDGRPGASRYTDAWARRDGRWVAVAAHVTRY
jgi:ketosteroid isomerase-like protein